MGDDDKTTKLTREQIPEFLKAEVGPIVGELVKESQEKLAKELKEDISKQLNENKESLLSEIVEKSKVNGKPVKLEPEEKGMPLARMIRALCYTNGDWDKAVAIAKEHYPNDHINAIVIPALENKVFEAGGRINKQLAAGDFTAGGALTFTTVSADFVSLLRNRTAVRVLGARTVPMPTGQVTLMEQTGGATAEWLGENVGQNTSAETFGQIKLTAKKLRVTVPVSNDLLLSADPNVDALVRDDAIAQAAVKEDVTYLRGLGVVAYEPKGLAGFIADPAVTTTNRLASAGAGSLANATTDLGKLVVALLNQNMPMTRPAWMMSPRTWNYLMTVRDTNGNFAFRAEMLLGRLWGWPFVYTNQIPINLGAGTDETEIYLADMDQVMIGEQAGMDLLVSREAAYKNSAGTLVSAFDLDQTIVRLILRLDFQLRYKFAAAMIYDADY